MDQSIQQTNQQPTTEQDLIRIEVKNKFTSIMDNCVLLFPEIKRSCRMAVIALSKIQEIKTEEDDQYARDLLIKVRTTYEQRSGERLGITRDIDEIKSFLMVPEKLISTDPKDKNSEYNRVKFLRDGFATEKKKKADAEMLALQKKQSVENEKTRIQAEIDRSVSNGMFSALKDVSDWAALQLSKTPLHQIGALEQQMNVQPNLKIELYDKWFNVAYSSQLVSPIEYAGIQKAARDIHTYELTKQTFSLKATEILQSFIQTLPQRRQELEELQRLSEQNAAAAAALKQQQDEQALKQKEEQERLLQEKQQQQLADIGRKEQDANMNNAFVAQIGIQSIAEQENTKITKIGTFSCREEDIVSVISEIFYYCMIHPKYKGIIKRDTKTKTLIHDENGRPVYLDWVEDMLDFYANNCEPKVNGVAISEKISTIQRK